MRNRIEGLGTVGAALRSVLAGTNGRPVGETIKLNTQRQNYGHHNGQGGFGPVKKVATIMRR